CADERAKREQRSTELARRGPGRPVESPAYAPAEIECAQDGRAQGHGCCGSDQHAPGPESESETQAALSPAEPAGTCDDSEGKGESARRGAGSGEARPAASQDGRDPNPARENGQERQGHPAQASQAGSPSCR